MQIFLILALLIAILAVIFAVQNITAVTITFFSWSIHTSLAVALLSALGVGVLITILLSIPGRLKGTWNSASQKRKHTALETERDRLQQKLDELTLDRDKFLKKWEDSELEITDLEQQIANLSGALEGMDSVSGIQPDSDPTQRTPSETSTPEGEQPSNLQTGS
jgi:uncharacterized integral membrane protein